MVGAQAQPQQPATTNDFNFLGCFLKGEGLSLFMRLSMRWEASPMEGFILLCFKSVMSSKLI
jgi:hypothetical protein